jgi:predicted metalloprotease
MTVGEARDVLGISRPKMAQLLKDGVLTVRVDPLDKRVKLVSRTAVQALAARSKREKAA